MRLESAWGKSLPFCLYNHKLQVQILRETVRADQSTTPRACSWLYEFM